MSHFEFCDWGLIAYQDAWDRQESLFASLLTEKLIKGNIHQSTIYFCEHPPVFTLGKSGKEENLLINSVHLVEKNATLVKTNRGGDITFHGPGQLVVYPLIDLDAYAMGIKEYIAGLEEVVIHTLAHFGVKGERLNGATGVWIDTTLPHQCRKIAAIGVKASRGITMHGLAFNISTDLSYFNLINPCGFTDKRVTSLEQEIQEKVTMPQIKEVMIPAFNQVFRVDKK